MKRIVAAVAALIVLVAVTPPAGAYTHLGGSNNTTLSIQWSQALFEADGATDAIVVRSDGFADSLAAGALAGLISAPVLMNPPGGGLDDGIATELERLGVVTVRVIGGTAAVSEATVDDLEAAGYDVTRLADENRISTAVAVMQQEVYSGATVVYLAHAYGDGSAAFADSIGAGMLAGTQGAPLLLTSTESLSVETRDALASAAAVETVRIAGGTAAVSQATEDALVAMGFAVERVAGNDRFETAALAAEASYDPTPPGFIALVDGLDANSWASGYAASARAGGAVVLSNGDVLPDPTVAFLEANASPLPPIRPTLYCAPEVTHDACAEAAVLLGEDAE